MWGNSCHARKVDELNNACRTITGTLRPTPLPSVYRLAGIAPPHIRRETRTRTQKHNQENDTRHTLHGHVQPRSRLKSRSSFMTTESLDPGEASSYRLSQWKEWDQNTGNSAVQEPTEELAKGTDLPRKEWVTLNPIRAVGPRITLRAGGGDNLSPPSISACSGPIFKKSDSMVFYGEQELTCQILSKSGRKHGSYGS